MQMEVNDYDIKINDEYYVFDAELEYNIDGENKPGTVGWEGGSAPEYAEVELSEVKIIKLFEVLEDGGFNEIRDEDFIRGFEQRVWHEMNEYLEKNI